MNSVYTRTVRLAIYKTGQSTFNRSAQRPSIPQTCQQPRSCISHQRRACLATGRATSTRRQKRPEDDRGPQSTEDTQTDFGRMDVLGSTAAPATAIDACLDNGFALDSGTKIRGSGLLLVGGEAFRWQPWRTRTRTARPSSEVRDATQALCNEHGQFDIDTTAWGLLDLVWPRPDLLVLGTGPRMVPVASATRQAIARLGIRLEVQDTRNAAAQFNLLATERGVQQVAAALLPIGGEKAW